jgi:hypothetical protein
MKNRIEKMSPDQWAQVPLIRQEAIQRESTPLVHIQAEFWIRELYKLAGHKPPNKIIWVDSPAIALRASLWASLWPQWFSAHLAFAESGAIAGVEFDEQKLKMYRGYIENVGTIFPFKNICIACERPIFIGWQDGVIHSETGMAVEHKDGWGIWAIEGVRVDEQIVMAPETQALEQIKLDDNEEVRRIRISRYGWHRYLDECGAAPIDTKIVSAGWMESLIVCEDMTVLCTYDPSTGRPYALEVDPSCRTCGEAQRYLMAPEIAFEGLGIDIDKVNTYPILRA